jgi:hypothetical protein
MWCSFSESSCKLHSIQICSSLNTKLKTLTWVSSCSYCTLYKLYRYFKEDSFEIHLKISSRERSFIERLEHYEWLKKFINTLEKWDFKNFEEIYIFRNQNHNNDCSKIVCWYF